MLSGEELAKVPLKDELCDVKRLKQHLHQQHGFPRRFSQRLLLRGQILDDATKLDVPVDLELVLLSYSAFPQTEKLLSAAYLGSVAEDGARTVQMIGGSNKAVDSGCWGF